eukprot:365535-Chlamydomonas_euryale.AAC.16
MACVARRWAACGSSRLACAPPSGLCRSSESHERAVHRAHHGDPVRHHAAGFAAHDRRGRRKADAAANVWKCRDGRRRKCVHFCALGADDNPAADRVVSERGGSHRNVCLTHQQLGVEDVTYALSLLPPPLQKSGRSLSAEFSHYTSTYGLSKIYRGMLPTLCRETIYAAGYLGVFPYVKEYLDNNYSQQLPGGVSLLIAGITGGFCASAFSHPFDTTKTRMQVSRGYAATSSVCQSVFVRYSLTVSLPDVLCEIHRSAHAAVASKGLPVILWLRMQHRHACATPATLICRPSRRQKAPTSTRVLPWQPYMRRVACACSLKASQRACQGLLARRLS